MDNNQLLKELTQQLLNDNNFQNLLKEKIDLIYAEKTTIIKEIDNIYKTVNKPINTETDFKNFMIFCNIKDIIEKENISQKQLSQITKIPIASLNGILNNTFVPSLEVVFKLSLVLNRPIEELFSYVDTQLIQPDII